MGGIAILVCHLQCLCCRRTSFNCFLYFYLMVSLCLVMVTLIKFWKDLWWGGPKLALAFPRLLFILSVQKDANVVEALLNLSSGISWNMFFSRDLYHWKVEIVRALTNSLKDVFLSSDFQDKKDLDP